MKKILHYLYILCAVIALVVLIYQVVPVFPYVRDVWVFINFMAIVFFYYLASKTADYKNERLT